ncbi:MAG: hypothetical protein IJ840_08045 [Bacteroidales bacterium]|nr:hypothetical protein [Bacteroidales bacterium]
MTKEEFKRFSIEVRGDLTAIARRIDFGSGWPVEADDIDQDALVRIWTKTE